MRQLVVLHEGPMLAGKLANVQENLGCPRISFIFLIVKTMHVQESGRAEVNFDG